MLTGAAAPGVQCPLSWWHCPHHPFKHPAGSFPLTPLRKAWGQSCLHSPACTALPAQGHASHSPGTSCVHHGSLLSASTYLPEGFDGEKGFNFATGKEKCPRGGR